MPNVAVGQCQFLNVRKDVFRRASDKSAILEMWHDVIVCDYSDRGDSDICN